LPPSQWRGCTVPDKPAPPDPTAWGAMPPLPSVIEQAIIEQQDGGSVAAILRQLEADPGDELAARLASLGRTVSDGKD